MGHKKTLCVCSLPPRPSPLYDRRISRVLCPFVPRPGELVLRNDVANCAPRSEKEHPLLAFRGMGDPQEEGDHHHAADRDQSETAGRARGWRGCRRLRALRHNEYNRGRGTTGAHDSGGLPRKMRRATHYYLRISFPFFSFIVFIILFNAPR